MGRFQLGVGSHVKVLCGAGTYAHWARHLCNGVVLQRNQDGIELHTLYSGGFITDSMFSWALWANKASYKDSEFSSDMEIYMNSAAGYNLIAKNCEHFATGSSSQVQKAFAGVLGIARFGAEGIHINLLT